MSIAYCKTVVTLLLTHWNYRSPELRHRYREDDRNEETNEEKREGVDDGDLDVDNYIVVFGGDGDVDYDGGEGFCEEIVVYRAEGWLQVCDRPMRDVVTF